MDKQELKSIVHREINDAAGYIGGDLSDQRSKALDYYLGEPFGNEVGGRSKVVSRDVADTIEWIKPVLLKTFAGSEQAVRFDPVGPEDEQQAEQESDYVNYVFYKENEGFLILYQWIADALLQKNGIVKVYWDESEEVTKEAYSGLTDDEFLKLAQDPELDPIEHSEGVATLVLPGPQGPMPQEVRTHDVTFKRTRKKGKVQVDPVPPEEFIISRDHNSPSLTKVGFVAHKVDRRVSDLISQGYDRKLVESLPSDISKGETSEEIARQNLSDDSTPESRADVAMRKIKVYECYLRVDFDGDGIAELRKVTYAGNEILDNEEVDRVPFESITPVILAHKFFGLSIYDLVNELQLIKSTLWRGMLDNLYLTNNPMREVAEGVNLDDLIVSRPGGIVRSKMIGSVASLDVPFVAGASFPMLEYIDKVRQERTGVNENMMGQNQSLLNDTAHGVERLMSAAEARIELIARIFAETGIKGLFKQIHELLMKHQDKQKVINLRNQWVPVNPSGWRTRENTTVKVGLGTGDRMRLSQSMMQIMSIQSQLLQQGGGGTLVTERNVFNAAKDFAKFSGVGDAQAYFTDPMSPEAQQAAQAKNQPRKDPLVQAEEVKAQAEQAKAQMRIQLDVEKEKINTAFEQERLAFEKYKFDEQHRLDIAKAEIEAQKSKAVDLGQPGIGAETKEGMKLSIAELQGVSEAATSGVSQLAEYLPQLIAQNQAVIQALIESQSKPINLVRGKDGRVTGAVRG